MPLQFMLTMDPLQRMHLYADREAGARALVGTPVGQVVGSMQKVRSARELIDDLVRGCQEAAERVSMAAHANAGPHA